MCLEHKQSERRGVTSHPVSLASLEEQSVAPELPGAPRPPGAVPEPHALADETVLSA